VGSAAIQIAQSFGARVIGTASEANQEYLRELGVEAVTYGPGLVDRVRSAAEEAGAVTAVLDAVGTEESVLATVELLPDRNRAVITAPGRHSQEAGIATVTQREGRIMDVATLAAEGLITFTIAYRLPLVEAADALELSRSGHGHGKIVLLP
jgi:NADPH:quinone reductase-like Zn-dependent oxidoreductase